MTIKNLAFFGAMAGVFSIAGVAHGDVTQLPSVNYVDAKIVNNNAGELTDSETTAPSQKTVKLALQNVAAGTAAVNDLDLATVSAEGKAIVSVGQENGLVSAATGEIGTAGIADGAVTFGKLDSNAVVTETNGGIAGTLENADDAKIPTEKAVKAAIDTAVTNAVNTASTNTNNAIAGAVAELDVDEISESGKPIVAVSQEDGLVDAETGEIGTAGIANGAITFNKMNDGAVATAIRDVNQASGEMLATEKAVRGALAGKEDVANKYRIGNQEWSDISPADLSSDDKYPSMLTLDKAIEARQGMGRDKLVIQGTYEDHYTLEGGNMLDKTGHVIPVNDNAEKSNLGTVKALEPSRQDDYIPSYRVVDTMGRYLDKRITRTEELLQNVSTNTSNIVETTESATSNNFVTSVTTENGGVTAVGSAQVTNDFVANDAGIDYTKMNNELNNINTESGQTFNPTSGCVASNPCLLTLQDGNFVWTNMELGE